jgi:hypothetical protein
MSCLIQLKIVNLLGDKTDDLICDHLLLRNASFFGRIKIKFLSSFERIIRKHIFREVL